MSIGRRPVLLLSALAGVFLFGFQSHSVAPIGTWMLVKGRFLSDKHEVELTTTVVKNGTVISSKPVKHRALTCKVISFIGQGDYVENRSAIVLDGKSASPEVGNQHVKFSGPWDRVSYKVLNDRLLSLVAGDGATRKIEFHVDGDKLTLVEGKEVEIYVRAEAK